MAKTKKWSNRALIILKHITDTSSNGRRWLPGLKGRGADDYNNDVGDYLNIGGSGDAAIIRSLSKAGMLIKDAPAHDCSNQYHWLAATDAGRACLVENQQQLAAAQATMIATKRKRDHASLLRQGWEEEALRNDYPEFYSPTI